MKILKPASGGGLVALWDRTKSRPDLADREIFDLAGDLRRDAKSGDVFWFELLNEEYEPLSLVIHLYVNEDCPDYSERGYKQRGGTFLLNIPSGRLIAGGAEYWSGHDESEHSAKTEVDISPGSYALTVREKEFDPEQHNAEMIDLLGEADWKSYNTVMWSRVMGCLPIVACIILGFLKQWHALWFYALPVAACYWLVQAAIWRFGRWARIDRRINEYESDSPGIIVQLRTAEDLSLIRGGSVRIS
jgi:hypothetical protein